MIQKRQTVYRQKQTERDIYKHRETYTERER